jgi:DMSO/TMAO reductase YedYZ molybdopterin-dependent catalytic subunit
MAMSLRPLVLFLALAATARSDPRLPGPSELPVLALPPRPAVIPGYTELDPSTGLHMTGTVQFLRVATWRLRITGKVQHPLSLAYDELRRMPRVASGDPLECRGNFEDHAHWAGASLFAVLDRAGLRPNARSLELVSADGYTSVIGLEEARSSPAFLAYEWEGKALPELHGYPVRAVFPGLPGYQWVKWLVAIRVQ